MFSRSASISSQDHHHQQHKCTAAAPSGPEEDAVQDSSTAAAAAAAAAAADSEHHALLAAGHTRSDATANALADSCNATPSSSSNSNHHQLAAAGSLSGCCSSELGRHHSPAGYSGSRWQALLAVARNRVVLYAGCWRILHDIPGNGILYYTPMIVQSMLLAAGGGGVASGLAAAAASLQQPASRLSNDSSSVQIIYNSSGSELNAAGLAVGSSSSSSGSKIALSGGPADPAGRHAASPGVSVVLLSAIPYAAASLFHLGNAWHSQRSGERRWHIAGAWLLGAAALLLLPAAAAGGLASVSKEAAAAAAAHCGSVSVAASVAAFTLLTLAHVGINGANGVQTGLVAAHIVPQEKALGLAMYNTIGCFGSFWGPVIIGVLHDATGGYAVAMWLLGGSLAAAAAMVARFKPERLDSRLVRK
jgi:hypothetical protein